MIINVSTMAIKKKIFIKKLFISTKNYYFMGNSYCDKTTKDKILVYIKGKRLKII